MACRKMVVALVCCGALTAAADGAFPDSQALFAPSNQPHRLLLTTNFGVVVTEDNGQSWNIICEIAMKAPNAFLYQLGPPPDDRLLAISLNGLSFSDDNGCSWALTDGGLPGASIVDAFADPSDGSHVLAIARARLPDGGLPPEGIYESHNGGASFSPTPLYSVPPGNAFLTGVEISAAQPSRFYATQYIAQSLSDGGLLYRPFVVRSDDDGGTWIANELTATLGSTTLRLPAVDPTDSSKLYLRLVSARGVEALAIATDGGAQATVPLTLPSTNFMSAFLRRADGSLIACQRPNPGCFLSTDNGGSFNPYLSNLHIKGLAERDGGLLLAGDNYADGFAVGALLEDGGVRPLIVYEGICGLVPCGDIPNACANWWVNQQAILTVPPTVCGHIAPDAGGPDAGPADAGTVQKKTPGCGCSGTAPTSDALLAGIVLVAALLARRKHA